MSFFKKVFKSEGKICVIAEKYSVAAEYAKVLGCERKDSYFEGEQYVVVWTDGHLCTLYDPEDYDSKYKVWKLDHLPMLPNGFWVKVRKGKQQRVDLIKGIVDREDIKSVYVATDPAREGNLIAHYLLMAIENKKDVYRVMINALNEKEIKQGFKNVKKAEEYKSMTIAAEARDEIDWLIGTNLSRLYSLIYNEKYYVGRCKTVIVSILAKREDEINEFKENLSYLVKVNFSNDKFIYSGTLDHHVNTSGEAEKIISEVSGLLGEIIDVKTENKVVSPEGLYNLNDLIRAANRRFNYTSDDVYNIAQKLYEDHKLISYSRTDSRHIKESMIPDIKMTLNCIKIERFKDKINDIKAVDKFIKRCVDDKKVTDHTAIIPLQLEEDKLNSIYRELSDKERNVYDLIVECFLNNFLDDYEYESICISTKINKHLFITREQKVKIPGWNKGCTITEVPGFKVGQLSNINKAIYDKKISRPKERYTDNTLFELLENPGKFVEDRKLKSILKQNGIGTNATRALLLKDIITNGYVVRDKKYILPTIQGLELIKSIKTDKLLEPFFTAEVEEKLMKLEAGEINKEELIKEVYKFIEDHVQEAKSFTDIKKKVNNTIGDCPVCKTGKIVLAGIKGYGCTNLKNTGCRFFIASMIAGVKIDKDQVNKLIKYKKTDPMLFTGSNGPFKARIVLDGNKTKFKKD